MLGWMIAVYVRHMTQGGGGKALHGA